jgi:hypothetical protein
MKVLIAVGDPAIARALERMLRNEDVTVGPGATVADGYELVLGDDPELLAAIRARPDSPPCVLLGEVELPLAAFDAVVASPVMWEALCEAIGTARMVHRRRTAGARRRTRNRESLVGLVVRRRE